MNSKLQLSETVKPEIILKLLEWSKSHIMTWHNQAYVAGTASVGLMLLITKTWFSVRNKSWTGLIMYEAGILAFAVISQFYLLAAQRNYEGNEELKVKCEYALRLKDEDVYLDGMFFWSEKGKTDKGLPTRDIKVLRWSHAVFSVLLAALCVITFYFR